MTTWTSTVCVETWNVVHILPVGSISCSIQDWNAIQKLLRVMDFYWSKQIVYRIHMLTTSCCLNFLHEDMNIKNPISTTLKSEAFPSCSSRVIFSIVISFYNIRFFPTTVQSRVLLLQKCFLRVMIWKVIYNCKIYWCYQQPFVVSLVTDW